MSSDGSVATVLCSRKASAEHVDLLVLLHAHYPGISKFLYLVCGTITLELETNNPFAETDL